jgi:glutamate--cysteine ligase
VFPEVRVKHAIEVRGADCVPLPLAMSFVALFEGLFYCDRALDEATELTDKFSAHGARDERFDVACRSGLEGLVGGRSMASWAEELITIALGGLERSHPDDVRWMKPLIEQVARGESPGRTLHRRLGDRPTPQTLIDATDMIGA